MAIITLTSDWNNSDNYVGAVKGSILSLCPSIPLVDISHQVQPFNIAQAAYILRNCYKHFPEGTVHVCAVLSDTKENRPHLVVKNHEQYFISADNGIFGLMFPDGWDYAIKLPQSENPTFPTLSTLVPAACSLAQGKAIEEMGDEYLDVYKQIPLRPTIDESVISGSIIYIDSYKNVISNVSKELFDRVGKGRRFEILVQSNYNKTTKISTTYYDVLPGELVTLFNSSNLLEVAIHNGTASTLLNLDIGSTVRIKFYDTK